MTGVSGRRLGLRHKASVALLGASLFACDNATKVAAQAGLSGGRTVPLVGGFLELRYTANDDTAFNLLRLLGLAHTPALLLALSTLALVGVVVAWIVLARTGGSIMVHVAFALVLAGALGNLIDRAAHGYVVDFIHVARWPVFNVADIAVCVGAGLLLLARARAPSLPV
jgi:signal peptidase II